MAPIILGKEMTPRHMEIAINDLCALDHIGTMRFSNPQDGYGSAPGEERALLTDCPENSGIIQWLCDRDFTGPGMTQEDLFDLIIDSGLVSDGKDGVMDLINWCVEEELKINGEGTHVKEWCDDVPEELQEMWNRYEVANDMEKFEAWENKENMLAAQPPIQGPFMVPDSRTLPNIQWANMWDGTPVVAGEFPFTTMMLPSQRPASHDLYDPEFNKMDEQNRIVVCAQMTQFGSKYHTATCEFGRIIVPLKFNRYLKDVGENMWLLIRLMPSQRFNNRTGQKMSDRKHPFSCIKVL